VAEVTQEPSEHRTVAQVPAGQLAAKLTQAPLGQRKGVEGGQPLIGHEFASAAHEPSAHLTLVPLQPLGVTPLAQVAALAGNTHNPVPAHFTCPVGQPTFSSIHAPALVAQRPLLHLTQPVGHVTTGLQVLPLVARQEPSPQRTKLVPHGDTTGH